MTNHTTPTSNTNSSSHERNIDKLLATINSTPHPRQTLALVCMIYRLCKTDLHTTSEDEKE